MAATGAYIIGAELDKFNNVWAVGRSLNRFDGSVLTYYTHLNSAVPSNEPYFLDTRSISIDEDSSKWVGCAYTPSLPTSLVFVVEGPYADPGTSWGPLEIVGSTGDSLDVPTIYASPFGEEVLAFVSPLNGGSGTGPAGVYGTTGGSLHVYNKVFRTWSEPAEGFTWPHIYDIKAKGILGATYEYYLATSDGIYIIPEGTLEVLSLEGGQQYIDQATIWNSKNTSLPTDIIYSIDFDENGNLWIGTDAGLVYWDQSKFYVWDSSSLSGLVNEQIYIVKSRPNGHVFFTAGNPNSGAGTGLYHFNGDTLTNYTTSNSDLPSDDIFAIMLSDHKSVNNGLTIYPNDVFLAAGNNIVKFDYVIPHIYATTKYTGTTGWNFVFYTPSTEALPTDEAKLPKANKYTWDYPSWQTYQPLYLQYKHPGLDPRNLFLEANLKAIADGRAANQDYWNLGLIPNYDAIELARSLQDSQWVDGVTGGLDTIITSTTYLDKKYIAGGYSTRDNIYFGPKNNLDPLEIANPNPTLPSYLPRSGQKVGFVAYYNEAGQVQDVLTIRGYDTQVCDVKSSPDEKSLYILGTYLGYVEVGSLIFSSTYPGAAGLTGGPTGGPIGFSNIQTPGITGSPYSYPWIYSGTQSIPATGPFVPSATGPIDVTAEGMFLLEIERNLGSETSYGGINFGATGSPIQSSYKLKDYRIFPGASSSNDPRSSSNSVDTVLYEKTLSLSVSDYEVNIAGTMEGGISTYKNEWDRNLDLPSTTEFIFSSWDGSSSYLKSGFWVSLGSELELLKTASTYGTGGNVIFNSVQKDQGTLTYLITGTSDSYSFSFLGTGATGGITGSVSPFYLIPNYYSEVTGYKYIQTNSAPLDVYQGINSEHKNGKYIIGTFYSGTASVGTYTSSQEPNYNGYSLLTVEITPSQSSINLLSNKILPVDLNTTSIGLDSIERGYEGQTYYSIFTEGGTSSNYIYKVNSSGGLNGSIGIYGTGHIKLSLDEKDNLFMGGHRVGETGPTALPVDLSTTSSSFTAFIPQYNPGVGIDLGNIISRAGSGAWTWADVHNSDNSIIVPILSTVFLSNYASSIFGKQNNQWILKDEKSGTPILDVKEIPYFIYTFTEPGYYSIQNKVEDANGNLYQVSKKAFIQVIDQSVPNASDPNPEFVNSVDYGYPPVNMRDVNQISQLSKDLLEQQAQIVKDLNRPTGSPLIIENDPNAFFTDPNQ